MHFKCSLQTLTYSIYALIVYSFYEFLSVFLNLYDLVIIIDKLELNTWNTLTNKETGAKTLKEFKRCLVKFDTDKMHFEPILATTKNRDIGYEYF